MGTTAKAQRGTGRDALLRAAAELVERGGVLEVGTVAGAGGRLSCGLTKGIALLQFGYCPIVNIPFERML